MKRERPYYNKMKIGQVMHLARSGDKDAKEAIEGLDRTAAQAVKDGLQGLANFNPLAGLEAQSGGLDQTMQGVARAKARREAEAVAREEAMIRELAAVRRSAERAEEREAAAHERARQAEEREQASLARSETRERFLVRLTVASFVVACIGSAAAVVAILW